MRFADTNILLYAVSSDPGDAWKRDIATQLLSEDDLALSVQVLQEFYVQATRATRSSRLLHAEARALITSWQRFIVQPLTVDIMDRALHTCDRYRVSYRDAAIIEAARAAGCTTVLSEDLQDGQSFGGVRVTNPFA